MTALIEIIIDGVKKFGGEIVGGILFVAALWLFPSLKRLLKKDEVSSEEARQKILDAIEANRREVERLKEELTRSGASGKRSEAGKELEQKRREEGRLREELGRREEALRAAEARRQEEARRSIEDEPRDARAQFKLGKKYDDAGDFGKAVKWYRLAAEQGHPLAQCNLGAMYHSGRGVRQDYSEAVKWYRLASEQGHTGAQCRLGAMYHSGEGVRRDYAEAVKWYRMAAKLGDMSARRRLARLCETW
ncbi:MAG: SEL1-like repeat protein [Synergistaceae bacterium]|nr:SEL1-like repeat protein [Synergistaceae bacterium]